MAGKRSLLRPDTLLQSISVGLAIAVVTRFVSFGRGILFARTLDDAQLGTWALAINAIHVLSFFLLLGIPSGLSRYVERHRQAGTLRPFLSRVTIWTIGSVLLLTASGMFFWKPLGSLLFAETATKSLVLLTIVTVLATVAFNLLEGVLHGLRLFRLASWIELVHSIGFVLLAAVLLFAWQQDAMSSILAHLVASGVVAMVAGAYVCRAVRNSQQSSSGEETFQVASGTWKALIVYSLATWGAGSLQAVWHCLDRYMLLHMSPAATHETLRQLGGYFIASKLALPMTAAIGMLSVVLLPHAARLWEEGRRDEVGQLIRRAVKLSALSMTLCGAAILALRPYVLMILVGRIPETVNLILPAVLVTIIAVSLHTIVRIYLLCRERASWIAAVWAAALVVNVVLNMILIPQYQILGAVVATLSSAGIAIMATIWASVRIGLPFDRGTYLACALPMLLLLPEPWMLLLLALAAVAVLLTNVIVSADDKRWINDWFAAKFPRLVASGDRQ